MKSEKTTDLEKIKSIVLSDISPLFNEFGVNVNFKRLGRHQMKCPIHDGDNSSSFSINLDTGYWRCWTKNCHEDFGKDIFGLCRGMLSSNGKNSSFYHAIQELKKIYNIKDSNVLKDKTSKDEDCDYFSHLVKLVKPSNKEVKNVKAIDEIPFTTPSEYFKNRGFLESTLKHFGVFDCTINKYKMKSRAVLPIHNKDGILIAYAGRAIKEYIEPKFLFTEGFKKNDILYNLHRAIESITRSESIILVEGQSDVWRLYECGVCNVVGLLGKELLESQLSIIKELPITKIAIFTDDDQPGRESKFFLQRKLNRLFTLKFPSLQKKDAGDMSIEDHLKFTLPQIRGFF